MPIPSSAPPSDPRSCHVVAIGASAGGLEAIERFFSTMPADLGAAFVIVQHLSPDFRSHMPELLERKTSIPVVRVVDGTPVEPEHIYLIPAGKEMLISGRRLRLTERSSDQGPAHPIDVFFRSLAHDVGPRAVGIVLSGTGSDGSRGIRDIHRSGGLVVAQDPESARFDGMPSQAAATGVVDVVLRPEAMPEALRRYVRDRVGRSALAADFAAAEGAIDRASGFDQVLELLRRANHVDFSHYKTATIARRMTRRMNVCGVERVEDYLEHVRENPGELDDLYRDLLIGVTAFFRDAAAFERVEREVVPAIVGRCGGRREARIWVAGCASGEEAYSLAILLDEAFGRAGHEPDYKIFATDLHQKSLQRAGAGVFGSDDLEGVSDERRERYFEKTSSGYRVHRTLRQRIVFAVHNVFRDAPFTQLDLVSCRNVLIYLQPLAQRKALAMFHFGLRAGGVLFLGASETPGELGDEFETVDARLRLFRKQRDVRLRLGTSLPLGVADSSGALARSRGSRPDASLIASYDQLLDAFVPTGVLVDDSLEVAHVFGGAEKYLQQRGGRPSSLLGDVIDDRLRPPLMAAFEQARATGTEVVYSGFRASDAADAELLTIGVKPLVNGRTKDRRFFVRFTADVDGGGQDPPAPPREVDAAELDAERMRSMEAELRFTRENLQATVEELETSNEELQAANEELLASNEELQSANEELHSVNQELYTVNTEHQRKIEELVRAHDDMDNLLALTRVGVVFLDEQHRVRRFTPEIARRLHLGPEDVGRPFEAFAGALVTADLMGLLRRATEEGRQFERRVVDGRGEPMLLRVAPYRRSDGDSGLALTLVDIAALERTELSERRFRLVAEQARDLYLLVGRDGSVFYANAAACAARGIEPAEYVGSPVTATLPALDRSMLETVFEAVRAGTQDEVFDWAIEGARESFTVDVAFGIVNAGDEELLLVAARDNAARKRAQGQLLLYRSAIEATQNGITIAEAGHGGEHPLVFANAGFEALTGYGTEEVLGRDCRFLQGDDTDHAAREQIRAALAAGRQGRVTLRNFRKDGKPFWNELSINPVRGEDGAITHFVGIQMDVTNVIDAEIAARNREAQLRTLIDSIDDGILGFDVDGGCIFASASATTMLGRNESEARGQTIEKVLGGGFGRFGLPAEALRLLGMDTSVQLSDVELKTADGAALRVDVGRYVVERDGEFVGSVVSLRDVTIRAEQAARLRDASVAAAAASRAKSEFLANMSHEIRTPLTAIIGFADVLQLGLEPRARGAHVDGIKRNAQALLAIVDDILDLSKIEAEQIEIELEDVALAEVLQDLQSLVGMSVAQKGLELRIECASPVPSTIRTDRTRLRQILFNLVGNAIKFTEHGAVAVVLAYDRDDGAMSISVKDTGIGIAEDVQARLFRPFQQADPSISRRFGGSGLGLSITRKLVERLGGTIEVESELGAGSRFDVRLPQPDGVEGVAFVRELELPDAAAGEAETAELWPPLRARILVVEDQDDVRGTVGAVLEAAGADVVLANSGPAALEAVRAAAEPIELVLLDLQMPGRSGFETLTDLRAAGFEAPVYAFTAQTMKGEATRCLEAGFDGFIGKPVDRPTLLRTLAEELAARRDRSRAVEAPAQGQRLLIVEDDADSAEAMRLLLERGGDREIRVAHSAAEAMALARSWPPQVCLVDQGLPDLTGAELCERLRAIVPRGVRFVAVTGAAPDTVTGFDAVVAKPVDIAELESVLEQAVGGSAVAGEGETAP